MVLDKPNNEQKGVEREAFHLLIQYSPLKEEGMWRRTTQLLITYTPLRSRDMRWGRQ
jgi:hypothetical protein